MAYDCFNYIAGVDIVCPLSTNVGCYHIVCYCRLVTIVLCPTYRGGHYCTMAYLWLRPLTMKPRPLDHVSIVGSLYIVCAK